MNEQIITELNKIEALRDWSVPGCFIGAAHADYAAATLAAMHRISGEEAQREIEASIKRCGLESRVVVRNGAMTALI